MRLLLSGEGPTDLGHQKPTERGTEFVPGPMAWVVDKVLERHHTQYSILDIHLAGGDCVTHVHETALAAMGKRGSERRIATTAMKTIKLSQGCKCPKIEGREQT